MQHKLVNICDRDFTMIQIFYTFRINCISSLHTIQNVMCKWLIPAMIGFCMVMSCGFLHWGKTIDCLWKWSAEENNWISDRKPGGEWRKLHSEELLIFVVLLFFVRVLQWAGHISFDIRSKNNTECLWKHLLESNWSSSMNYC